MKYKFHNRKSLLLILLVHAFIGSYGQYSMQLKIHRVPVSHRAEDIFIAGDFNGWNPGDDSYKFARSTDTFFITIPALKPGTYQFKFTRVVGKALSLHRQDQLSKTGQ